MDGMECEERVRLDREHSEAGLAFQAARKVLVDKVGICPKEEYISLNRAVDTTWEAVQRARGALDDHIRSHGCHKA